MCSIQIVSFYVLAAKKLICIYHFEALQKFGAYTLFHIRNAFYYKACTKIMVLHLHGIICT